MLIQVYIYMFGKLLDSLLVKDYIGNFKRNFYYFSYIRCNFFFKLEEKLILIEASINLITRNSYMLFYYIVPLSIEVQIYMNSLFKNVG